MKKVALWLLVLLTVLAVAQDSPQARYMLNAQQDGKRFQMFFSPFVRADTFLVDTSQCRVWQMVSAKDTDQTVFQLTPVRHAPSPLTPTSGRYILVFSPHVRADTFLLDTIGGSTWQMVTDKDGNLVFQEVARV